jgi:hypothetical protein
MSIFHRGQTILRCPQNFLQPVELKKGKTNLSKFSQKLEQPQLQIMHQMLQKQIHQGFSFTNFI